MESRLYYKSTKYIKVYFFNCPTPNELCWLDFDGGLMLSQKEFETLKEVSPLWNILYELN
jgi:hypothetical protein